MASMSEDTDFDVASTKFLSWFKAQPEANFHEHLRITDLSKIGRGRGITATKHITAGTDLFTIPRSSIISVDTSELAKALPELFQTKQTNRHLSNMDDEDAEDLPRSWLNLILILLREFFHRSTSSWAPYLSILPSDPSKFDTLMFWTEAELSYLQASAIVTKIGQESASSMFKSYVIPVVKQHPNIFLEDGANMPSDDNLLQMCHVVGSSIMSYAFDLQPDDDEEDDDHEDGWVEDQPKASTMGMVPMADMLNADAEFNAHLSHGDDALTMTSLRDIEAGEEVLNYYGPLPNAELLRRYGYTSLKHERYNVVEIDWPTVKEEVVHPQHWTAEETRVLIPILQKFEVDEGLSEEDGFILEREAGDPTEEGLCPLQATFENFPDDLIGLINDIVTQTLNRSEKKRSRSEETHDDLVKSKMLGILRCLTQKRLNQYPTSINQDTDLLESQKLTKRQIYGINVRMGEKQLLTEALAWTDRKREKYRLSMEEQSSSRVTKKSRR